MSNLHNRHLVVALWAETVQWDALFMDAKHCHWVKSDCWAVTSVIFHALSRCCRCCHCFCHFVCKQNHVNSAVYSCRCFVCLEMMKMMLLLITNPLVSWMWCSDSSCCFWHLQCAWNDVADVTDDASLWCLVVIAILTDTICSLICTNFMHCRSLTVCRLLLMMLKLISC